MPVIPRAWSHPQGHRARLRRPDPAPACAALDYRFALYTRSYNWFRKHLVEITGGTVETVTIARLPPGRVLLPGHDGATVNAIVKRVSPHSVNLEIRNGWKVRAHEEWHTLDRVLAGLYCIALIAATLSMQGCGDGSAAASDNATVSASGGMLAGRLPATHSCEVYLRSKGETAFRDFSFDIVYPAGLGYGENQTANSCRATAPGAHVLTSDGVCTSDDTHCSYDQRVLRVNFDSNAVRAGANDLAVCRFRTYRRAAEDSFNPSVTFFSNGRTDEPGLGVIVSAVDCAELPASSTTTFVPVTTPTLPNNPGVSCAGSGCVDGDRYGVEIALASTAAVSSIQFEVDYARAPGSFQGQGGAVQCTAGAEMTAIMGFNNCTAPGQPGCDRAKLLRIGVASVDVLNAPLVVTTCVMRAAVRAPTPRDFSIRVIEAVDEDFAPVTPAQGLIVVTGVFPLP